MDTNPDLISWGIAIGFFLPTAIAKVNASYWSSEAKAAVTFVACFLAALGTAYFNGDFTGTGVVSVLVATLGAATVSYQTYWKPSGIAAKLER